LGKFQKLHCSIIGNGCHSQFMPVLKIKYKSEIKISYQDKSSIECSNMFSSTKIGREKFGIIQREKDL
jgi:hypothetical protein